MDDKYPKKVYGAGNGMSRGLPYNPKRCAYEVQSYYGSRWPSYNQCVKSRGQGPRKLFCKIHDPANIKVREEVSSKKLDSKMKEYAAPYLLAKAKKRIKKMRVELKGKMNKERAKIWKEVQLWAETERKCARHCYVREVAFKNVVDYVKARAQVERK